MSCCRPASRRRAATWRRRALAAGATRSCGRAEADGTGAVLRACTLALPLCLACRHDQGGLRWWWRSTLHPRRPHVKAVAWAATSALLLAVLALSIASMATKRGLHAPGAGGGDADALEAELAQHVSCSAHARTHARRHSAPSCSCPPHGVHSLCPSAPCRWPAGCPRACICASPPRRANPSCASSRWPTSQVRGPHAPVHTSPLLVSALLLSRPSSHAAPLTRACALVAPQKASGGCRSWTPASTTRAGSSPPTTSRPRTAG